jgi:hypothetical protein
LSEDERREAVAFKERNRSRQHAPRVEIQSAPGKPLNIEYPSPIDIVRLASTLVVEFRR